MSASIAGCACEDVETTSAAVRDRNQHAVQVDQPPQAPLHGEVVTAIDKSTLVIFQARDGTYWFGSDGQGVYRSDGKSIVRFTKAHGLRGDRVRGIQEDRGGNILVKSDGGISIFEGRAFRQLNPVNADPSTGEWRLDADDLWFIGWQDEGVVYRYDGTSLHRLAFPRTQAGDDHIARFPRDQFPMMAYSPYDVYTIFRDSKGHLWFGTGTLGVCRYDGRTFAWASRGEIDFSDDDAFGVRSIIEGKDGKFWFSRTLHRFDVAPSPPDERGNIALGYRKEPGISAATGVARDGFTHIISTVKDKDGDLWMATLDGSVWRYDGNGITHYTVRRNDAVVTLFTIYLDLQGNVWLGSHQNGPYKFNGSAFEQFAP